MKKIVLVDIITSTADYIDDIYEAGYEPIILELPQSVLVHNYYVKLHNALIKERSHYGITPKIIVAKKKYEETLKMIKDLEPSYILQGSDDGVSLATRLSNDLGLKGNGLDFLEKIKTKYNCQMALKEAGVRYIKSEAISSVEEALSFFHNNHNKPVVIKPMYGVSSIGVFVCENETQIKKAMKKNESFICQMYNGGTNKILIQECINGTEYVLNTVSCNGKHVVTSSYVYRKKTIPNIGKIYLSSTSLFNDEEIVKTLAEYEFKVLDALNVKYGPVHAEIMVDEDGPVLIEANCRICGFHLEVNEFERALDLHESKVALMSYINPNYFDCINNHSIIYKNNYCILICDLFIKKTAYVVKTLFENYIKNMPGYSCIKLNKTKGLFFETVNLSTSPGDIYFVVKDKQTAINNYNHLYDLQDNHEKEIYKKIDLPLVGYFYKKFM